MLSVTSDTKDYIANCRSGMGAQLSAYKTMAAAKREKAGVGQSGGGAELDVFEPLFLANMVLVLDHFFVHRARGLEGKD